MTIPHEPAHASHLPGADDACPAKGRTLRVRLPFPHTRLRPNGTRDRWERHRLGKEYAAAVAWVIREACGPPPYPRFEKARLRLTAVYPNRRGVWDDDALVGAFKHGRDVLTDQVRHVKMVALPLRLGLIHDDSPAYLTMERPETVIDRAAAERYLILELTEESDGA